MEIGCRKSLRIRSRLEKNCDDAIREATSIALTADSEEIRIGVLTVLRGVGWPVASVVLHFFHRDPYPIIDFRALWSVGASVPPTYSFSFWWEYTEFCRRVAQRAAVDMRTLDRALWQYSKDHQEP